MVFVRKIDTTNYYDSDDFYSDFDASMDGFGSIQGCLKINQEWFDNVMEIIEKSHEFRENWLISEDCDMLANYTEWWNGVANKVIKIEALRLDNAKISGLFRIIFDNRAENLDDMKDGAVKIFSLLCGEPYKISWLHGAVQGDCVECIYPERLETVDWIESVLFNTGIECDITEDTLPGTDKPDWNFSEHAYYNAYNDDELVRQVAKAYGVLPNNVVIVDAQ